ncbi:MAG TPA: hypothetical protein VIH42_04465, partial [Thermoguttaceae bacterium]
MEYVVSQRRSDVELLSGTAVELGSRQITARVVADFQADDTAQFTMEAELSKSWIIDSIEAFPAQALADWSVENQAEDGQKLLLHLAKIPTPAQPLRLVINGRRLRTYVRNQWSVDELLPLRFTSPLENKRLVSIQAIGPYELKLSGAEQLTRLSASNLTPAELKLFAEPPQGLLFQDDAGAAAMEIAIGPQKPSYSGTVLVDVEANNDRLVENYVLKCVPETARVDRVLIQLSQSREVPPRWTLGTDDDKQVIVRQWSKGEQASAGLGTSGDTWELTLPRPQSTPFEIHGRRETALNGSTAVCLASLPEATSQRGTLVINDIGGEVLNIDNRRLKSIPPESVSPDRNSITRATFRYDPIHDVTLATEPALMLSTASKDNLPSIFVWNCQLESWYQIQGDALHLATFEVQNNGSSGLQLFLPPGVSTEDVRGLWVDEAPVSWQPMADLNSAATAVTRGDILWVPLSPAKRFPTVSIRFITHEKGLSCFGTLAPCLPQVKVPMLWGTWILWLPPGFEVVAEDPCMQTPFSMKKSYSRRLFGPLGRNPDQEAFHPLVVGDWLAFPKDLKQSQLAQDNAHLVLEMLGAPSLESRADTKEKPIQWRRILQPASGDGTSVKLLVDRRAMSRFGIEPNSNVQSDSEENRAALGLSRLLKANLALLVHENVVLLTSQVTAAIYHSQLTPLGNAVAWRVLPGPLAERLQEAGANQTDPALVPAEFWGRLPNEGKSLWIRGDPAGCRPADTQAWIAQRVELSSNQLVPVKYVHCRGRQSWAAVIFLLSVALCSWKAAQRPILFTILTGAVGVLTFMLPETYAPLTSAAVLGVLAFLFIRILRLYFKTIVPTITPAQKSSDEGSLSASGSAQMASQAGMILLAVCVLEFCAVDVKAGEAAEKPQSAISSDYSVFIPIDAEKKPVGDNVYLPERFYNELHRRAAKANQHPQGWMLESALYYGTLEKDAATGRLALDALRARFDLHVFGRMVQVSLPFRRENVNLIADSVTLDGRSIQAQWKADGSALMFEA